jgi:hypothetical protein
MATSNRVFVSPGVYTSEKELSFVAQSVGVTTLGMAGETQKGPAFEPIFITNYNEFTTYFGETSPEKFVNTQIPKYETAYIAKSYLQQSNQLFVTRILGLSGYDAGPSWSFSTIANVDLDTVGFDSSAAIPNNTFGDFLFTGTTGTSTSSIIVNYNTPVLGNPIPFPMEIPFTKSGNETTIKEQLRYYLYQAVQQYGTSTASTVYSNTLVFGSIPLSSSTSPWTYGYASGIYGGSKINEFTVDNMNGGTADLSAITNRTWYNTLFQTNGAGAYSGWSTGVVIDDLGFVSGAIVSGTARFYYYQLTGTSYTEYDNLVVSTLRSRGVSDYTIADGGPVYEVSGTTQVGIDCITTPETNPTGVTTYNEINYNPYAVFTITGTTNSSTAFSFNVSLDNTDSTYITKVLGVTNFDKNKTSNPLFVEEIYPTLLGYGYNYGYIRGIKCALTTTDGARETFNNAPLAITGDSLGWYLDRYQTPETPWVVSQLQGNKVTRLFRFVSISDGNMANTEIKISILNVSFTNGTFDVAVRSYYDSDSNPVVIEKFTNCTMDPNTPGYVAKKVGTSNGEYGLNSKYVMVEVNSDADVDTLPCGFEGYLMREYVDPLNSFTTTPPFPVYKTKYDFAGEVLYVSPIAGTVRSSGDKVRRTYLGLSDKIGTDEYMWQYKGRKYEGICNETNGVWNYQTKGFHMDSGATVCTIGTQYTNSGDTAFYVGDGSFSSEPTQQSNPYYYLYSRKFTLAFQGGFDGWNIYDEHRTNQDIYQIGQTPYLNSACPSVNFPTSSGHIFKTITIDGNSVDWANTDYYAYLLGIQTFNNPAAVNINVFATPGIDLVNNPKLVDLSIDMIENDRADSIYIVTLPDWEMYTSNSTDYSNFLLPQDAVDSLDTSDIDSNYTATYYPWVLIKDSVNNTNIYLPPTGEVTRNLALTDNIAFPWFATAGYTRGIVNAVKARKKLTQEDRDTLYTGRINPIATFSDVGTVIWGNKTLQVAESALNRINVRRLLLQARKLISAVAIRLLFEQNDAKVRQDFLDAVNPILDAIRRDRGLYDFRVTVSSSVEDLDKNQLVGKIYIKPTKALEFIDIEFLITPTGASFENI